jgi:GNAT superfamily N-acetyltransferase
MAVSRRWSTARRTSTPASRTSRRCRSADPQLEVRPISEEDFDAVCRALPGWPPSRHRDRFDKQLAGDFLYLIGWVGDAVAGHVSVEWTPRNTSSFIERRGLPGVFGLEVVPHHRGKGFGRALMLAVEEELRSRGFAEVWLDTGVSEGYAAARRMYDGLGYRRLRGDYVISARVPDDVETDRLWVDVVFQMTKRLV